MTTYLSLKKKQDKVCSCLCFKRNRVMCLHKSRSPIDMCFVQFIRQYLGQHYRCNHSIQEWDQCQCTRNIKEKKNNITVIVCIRIQNVRYTYTWLVMYRFSTMIAEQYIFVIKYDCIYFWITVCLPQIKIATYIQVSCMLY